MNSPSPRAITRPAHVVNPDEGRVASTVAERCSTWLRNFLHMGPRAPMEIGRAAYTRGFTTRDVANAVGLLNIVEHTDNRGGVVEIVWGLPSR